LRIININKAQGWTSFDVVRFIKRKFDEKKVGHLGTLDPMATGVLPVFLGQATRLIPLFNDTDKTYRALCKLGESTDTFDAEGRVTESHNIGDLNSEQVTKAVYTFLGTQKQQVPAYSASKIKGIPSYKLARQGLKVPAKTRSVIFHELDVEAVDLPFVKIRIHCSKGTYIRALANDLGQKLKVGAHLTSLDRLACGKWFKSGNSISIEKLEETVTENNVPWISPLELLDHLNTIVGSAEMVVSIKQGRSVEFFQQNWTDSGVKLTENCVIESETNSVKTKVVDSCQNLVAIGHIMWENKASFFHPIKVFV
jgi:tRNA pseudouridine55 synthase